MDTSWGNDPDFDGDGFDDVTVASIGADSVVVFSGSATGPAQTRFTTLAGTGMPQETVFDVQTAGDMNGDGFVDLAVTAVDRASNRSYALLYLGSVRGLSGPPVLQLDCAVDQLAVDPCALGVGDLDGDGFADLAISDVLSRTVRVLHGTSDLHSARVDSVGNPLSASTTAFWGGRIGRMGDVNGDTIADLGVGALVDPNRSVEAFVYLGRAGASLADPLIVGPEQTDIHNQASAPVVASAGDMNGDGLADVVLASPSASINDAGSVFVFMGAASGAFGPPVVRIDGSPFLQLGIVASFGGDVNGDGYADLLVDQGGMGTATHFLYWGGTDGISTARVTTSSIAYGGYMHAVGDVNMDGFDDLAEVVPCSAGGSTCDPSLQQLQVFLGSARGVPTDPSIVLIGMLGNGGIAPIAGP